MGNLCLCISLVRKTYNRIKNSYFDEIKLYFYTSKVNTILNKIMIPAFKVLRNIFYLNISLYKSFTKIYLLAIKSILQAE